MTPDQRQRGIALVMALVMLTLLTMIGISAIRASNTSLRIVGNFQTEAEVETAARSASSRF